MPKDLWDFALALYARPGVEEACLRAQDAGENVCLLLCGAWLDARRIAWSADRQRLLQSLTQAHESTFIAPLRALRDSWRAAATSDTEVAVLREEVKQLELHAERLLLERLQAACQSWPADMSGGDAGAWHSWTRNLTDDTTLRQLLRYESVE